MNYDAMTFDTQTVQHNGFHFEGGLLAELRQFRNGQIVVAVSEIVRQEILKHLTEKTREAAEAFQNDHRKAVEYGLKPADEKAFGENVPDPRAVAETRLAGFLEAIGADNVAFDQVSIGDLTDRYFLGQPPFSGSGKKKNEFPDAIALISLEQWAQTHGLRLLAISGDKDWAAFAAESQSIDVVPTLAEGLQLLQENVEATGATVQRLLANFDTGVEPDLGTEFRQKLEFELSTLWVFADADSAFHAEASQVELTFNGYQFEGEPGSYAVTVVHAGPGLIAARIELTVGVTAEADFTLSAYDSIDKDYVTLGHSSARRELTLEIGALVTFTGNFESGAVEIDEIELVDAPRSIEFGYVELDEGWYDD